MATQSKRLPFQVAFRQGTGSYETRLPVQEFCAAEEVAARSQPMVILTENLPLRLQFQAEDKQARLYMDGLESIPQGRLAEDAAGRPYLVPGTQNLFSYDNYSWIPGFYWLEVVIGQCRHFALAQVQPKELSMAEWTAMRDELENELRGLAWGLARRDLGLDPRPMEAIPPTMLHRFLVVRNSFPRVMAALADLQQRVNHRVKKEERRLSATKPHNNDPATGAGNRRTRPDRVLVRQAAPDFDLPENRWVKHIVRTTSADLHRFLVAVHSLLARMKSELAEQERFLFQNDALQRQNERLRLWETLQTYQQAAEQMVLGLQLLRHTPWYQQVTAKTQGSLPFALQADGRYHALYQLFRQLQQEQWQPQVDQAYRYQWKRTDKLYEIWCVIQLCRSLADIGFVPVSGWLYDADLQADQLLVPNLAPGTRLVFQRDDVALHLLYDQEIPRQSSETQANKQPVYTQDVHNRPDLRLDIYHDEAYAGCLVVECKYRPLRGFWKAETLTSGYDRPKAMSQLISYGMAIRSRYLQGQPSDWAHGRTQAVLEVWAFYPGSGESTDEIYIADHRVRIFRLRPGVSAGRLTERLAESLSRS